MKSTYYSISGVFSSSPQSHFVALLTAVNGAKVAGGGDFNDNTGELKEVRSKRPIIVLDEEKTFDTLRWLASSCIDGLTEAEIEGLAISRESTVSFNITDIEEKTVIRHPFHVFVLLMISAKKLTFMSSVQNHLVSFLILMSDTSSRFQKPPQRLSSRPPSNKRVATSWD